jgi:hypothetical protein
VCVFLLTQKLFFSKHKPRHLHHWESDRLWKEVSDGLDADDVPAATEGKKALEAAQRAAEDLRRQANVEFTPRLFQKDSATGIWSYKFANEDIWTPEELVELEDHGVVSSRGPLPPHGMWQLCCCWVFCLFWARFVLFLCYFVADWGLSPLGVSVDFAHNQAGVDMRAQRRLFDGVCTTPAGISADEERRLRSSGIDVPRDLLLDIPDRLQVTARARRRRRGDDADAVADSAASRVATRKSGLVVTAQDSLDPAALAARLGRVERAVLQHLGAEEPRAASAERLQASAMFVFALVMFLLVRLVWLQLRVWELESRMAE